MIVSHTISNSSCHFFDSFSPLKKARAMISTSYDFGDFVGTVKTRDYLGIIYAAEQEATEAERLCYRFRKSTDVNIKKSKPLACSFNFRFYNV
jgi:hypothetical protein